MNIINTIAICIIALSNLTALIVLYRKAFPRRYKRNVEDRIYELNEKFIRMEENMIYQQNKRKK